MDESRWRSECLGQQDGVYGTVCVFMVVKEHVSEAQLCIFNSFLDNSGAGSEEEDLFRL